MHLVTIKKIYLLALTAILLTTASTWSQQSSSRRGGGFSMMSAGGNTPDYMLRDLQQFKVALDLTDAQVGIVEQILRDYDETFREATNANQESTGEMFRSMRGDEEDPARQQSRVVRERMSEVRSKLDSARELGDEEGMGELQARLNKELDSLRSEMQQLRVEQWQSPQRQTAIEGVALLMQDQLRLKRKMRDEFESDLVAILEESQLELWPPLQRKLIRDRLLPRGRLSGETVDVIGLVEQQKYDDQILVNLVPALSTWDESVTAALTTRDDHMIENQGVLMNAMRTMDTNSGVAVMKIQATLAEAVRDINDLAIQEIVYLLPEGENATFETVAKERGYPRIYRASRSARAFQAAMELEELEPDILQAINELFDAMNIEIEYANTQIYDATHRWEAKEQLDRVNRFAERITGGSSSQPESPIRKAEDARRAIENNYIEQLKLLLTPEQIELLVGLDERQTREGQQRTRGQGDRQNRGGFEPTREGFMQRFDKDGDGELSEAEREEIRSYYRNGGANQDGGRSRGGPPPPPGQ